MAIDLLWEGTYSLEHHKHSSKIRIISTLRSFSSKFFPEGSFPDILNHSLEKVENIQKNVPLG